MRIPKLLRRLKRFTADESGSYTVELVLMLPVLCLTIFTMLTFIDAYRAKVHALRVTYAVGDMLSRAQFPVTHQTITGLAEVFDELAIGAHNTSIRVTSIMWDESNDTHLLVWSDSARAGSPTPPPQPINDTTLPDIIHTLPNLANGDSVIVVESWLYYKPPFDIGFGDRTFEHLEVVSPRFIPVLRYETEGVTG
ncbi:TadE/TadG family type IV pilus assembly protein [Palleronia sp.]|uniref:TadE/TadG family type IV pilus assembly protein n=1 Tax=Palleronia sp. TaxID=1940284 RepID=UPI0035C8435F